MSAQKIMIIRHAEKPAPAGGVDEHGKADPESLTVRGWQRAGALVPFFARPWAAGIARPAIIYAAGTGRHSPSARPVQTAAPLAAALGCPFVTRFMKEETAAAMADALDQAGPVLMVWEHKMIPPLAAELAPVPDEWPEDCFDRVWVFAPGAAGWHFAQTPQNLLAGDSAG